MEATLKFDLPEERDDHIVAVHAADLYLTLLDMDNWLRNKLKYGHDLKTADEALEIARDKLFDVMEDRGVNLDMMS
jgi:hypothetical protein